MKSYSIAIICGAAAVALLASPAATVAQTVTAPIQVRNINSGTKVKTNGEWLKAQVIHADANSIMVSVPGNERTIYTFTLSPAMKDKMQALVDKGGYQFGDRVKILHQHGQTVALKISGRPSKPS